MLAQQHTLSDAALNDVEPYQQIWDYSCGAAVLKAVLKHWGEEVDEPTLIREVGVDPKTGSTAQQVTDAARKRGYLAQPRTFRSIRELGTYTDQDIPVIIAIRSFRRPNQGHFVVATQVKPHTVEIMDPNVRGNRRSVPHAELDARWLFRNRIGVLVVPKRKRSVLGGADTTSRFTSQQKAMLAVAGALIAVAAATAGAVIYRRRAA